MNGQSTEDRGGADRRIGEWADLTAMSRPPAARPEVLSAKVEVGVMKRGRSRHSVAGLAAVLLITLVVAGVGFGLSRQRSAVAPSASASAVVNPSGSPILSGSPSPSASPLSLIASPGLRVAAIGRIDETTGWAYVSSSAMFTTPHLIITDDAGATWRDATPPGQSSQPIIEFVDANHGWFLGADGPLWRTADGGRSWQETALPAGRTGMSASMSFVSASTGYLLLSADNSQSAEPWVLYRTGNGGASLQRVRAVTLPDEPPMSGPLPVIVFSGPLDGVIAGWRAVLRTQDGGAHWSTVSLPATSGSAAPRYAGVSLLRAFGPQLVLLAFIGGPTTPYEPTAYVSADAGLSWRPAFTASAESETDVWAIVDGQTWLDFTTGDGAIQVRATSDAGETWTTSTGAVPAGWHIMAVSFVSATDGWAIFEINPVCPPPVNGCMGSLPDKGEFAETHDGGLTWIFP